MKKFLLVAALALLPVLGFAQNNHFFNHETGSFDLAVNVMGQDMVTHTVFADFGALQYATVNAMGQDVVTVLRDGKSYMIKPNFQEVPAEDAINYNALDQATIDKYNIKMVGIEKMDGYDCLVYTLKMEVQGFEGKGKVWIWDGFTVRAEVNVMGMTVVTKLKNLQLDVPVDMSLFDIPE